MEDTDSLSIFCDESHPIKHDGCDFYVLGCCYTPTEHLKEMIDNLNKLKAKYGYKPDYEIKWSKINGKNINLAKEIIKLIKDDDQAYIRIWIVPNKTEKQYPFVLGHEELYNIMYRYLLKNIFEMKQFARTRRAIIYFDVRNTNSDDHAEQIGRYLELNYNISLMTHVTDSSKELLIQVIDLFIGATSYERLALGTSICKIELIQEIKKLFHLSSLNIRTTKETTKYNSFIWDGRYGCY